MRIEARSVDLSLAGRRIVRDASLSVEPGEFVALVGPNGSGKTTLLRSVCCALRPTAGMVRVGDADVWALSPRESARRTAVVPQDPPDDFAFTVGEVVLMGRTPHKGLLERENAADRRLSAEALDQVGLAGFEDRPVRSLSGGERQRVLIARALAQQSRVLLLDEPTNHLDIRAQLEILHLVRAIGVTVLAAIHDLNLAAAYADRVYVLRDGRVVAGGPVADVLTPDVVRAAFGVEARVDTHPVTGRPRLSMYLPDQEGETP